MRSAWLGSVLVLVGIAAGCSNAGSDTSEDVAPDEHHEWGNVTVDVTATGKAPDSLKVRVGDQPGTLLFPSASPPKTIEGALVEAKYTCGTPGLYEIELRSCNGTGGLSPGCLQAIFTKEGVSGSYVAPTGAHCDLTAGTAAIRIPPTRVGSSQAAAGSFTLECQDAAGGTTQMEGEFALTVRVFQLLC